MYTKDPLWVEEVEFLPYCSPHCVSLEPLTETGGVDPVWVETMTLLDVDLKQLLQMSHHKFWCQVS